MKKDIDIKCHRYGITYKEYYTNDMFSMPKEEFKKFIEDEKEWFAESISKITGKKKTYCLKRMEKICDDCEISFRRYFKYKYYNLHEISILNLVTVYSEEYREERLKLACRMLKKPKYKVKNRMKVVKEKYGITNNEFLSHDYGFFSNDEIKKEKEKIDYPYLISKESKLSYETAKKKTADAIAKFNVSSKTYKSRLYYTMSDQEIADDIEQRKDELLESVIQGAEFANMSLRNFVFNAKIDNLKYGTTMSDYILFGMYNKNEKERQTWINYDKDVRNLKRKYRLAEDDILGNKIKFNSTFPEEIGRKWWVNKEGNTYETFLEFTKDLEEIIIKPVSGKEGMGIKKLNIISEDLRSLYDGLMRGELTIVEECIKQHHLLEEFYPDCVHCCRIVAILDNDNCYFPQTSIKFGINAVSDNLATGSVCANIDLDTGTICTNGATKRGEIIYRHPFSDKEFKGFKVPYWKEALELSESVIRKIPNINMIGFDIAITEDGPIIVEGNDTPDFRVYDYPLIGQRKGMRYKLEPFITKYECNW